MYGFFGNIPAGAQYDSRAPWNDTTTLCTCAECGGTGKIWLKYDIKANESTNVTEEEYNALPTEKEADEKGERFCQYDVETCTACDGEGNVEEEFYEEIDY